jgi:uncharacterized protein YcbK (DUF882 family)
METVPLIHSLMPHLPRFSSRSAQHPTSAQPSMSAQPSSAKPATSARALLASRKLWAAAALAGTLCVTQPLTARTTHLRSRSVRTPLHTALLHPGALLDPGVLPTQEDSIPVEGAKYELRLRHLHTGETLNIVYRIGDTYLPAAIAKLNYFLRDHRTEDQSHYDPKEFDVLHNLLTRLGKPGGEIDVVCGYRSPWSNEFLRHFGGKGAAATGVAKNSQHVQAKAIDIRVPGVKTRSVRDAALSLQAGGVGYYPVSQFVHVDVGPVRQWTFNGRSE